MRTFLIVCGVALIVAIGTAFAVGLLSVSTDQPDGRYVIALAIDTSKIQSISTGTNADAQPQNSLDVKGRVTAVRPEKSELVVSENVKNWTFKLAAEGQVFINDRPGKLAELQPGDEAAVTFDRQGQQLIATVVRSTRK
jgi:hypothetical protein